MKRWIAAAVLALAGGTALAAATPEPAHTVSAAPVRWMYVSGTITAGTASYVERGVRKAEAEGASAVVIQLDTPGGLVSASWDLVETELNAKVPIVVWVGPRGAHAGSAGVFLTLAANVAAMAPATRIGAAHPIGVGEPDDDRSPFAPTPRPQSTTSSGAAAISGFVFKGDREHLARKLENDTVAWVTGIAQERGRNVEWARKAVLESDSITAQDAVDRHVVDLIAADREQLLQKLDGRVVTTLSGEHRLSTANADIVEDPMSMRELVFTWLANPTLISILMGIAMLGLYTEFQHPGAIAPAVIGGIALLGVLIGVQAVPVNYAGLLLIVLGFACFILEIKITSYGLLTAGGVAGVGLGLFLLVDKTTFTVPVSWTIAAPALAAMAGVAVFLTFLAARAMASVPYGDSREFLGRVVRAHTDLSPTGTVTLDGVLWNAISTPAARAGDAVRIVHVEGLTLQVVPAPDSAAAPRTPPGSSDT